MESLLYLTGLLLVIMITIGLQLFIKYIAKNHF